MNFDERWVAASFAPIKHLNPDKFAFITWKIQSLGRLEARLRIQEQQYLPNIQNGDLQRSFALDHLHFESELWVLGAYEVSRTLDHNFSDKNPKKSIIKQSKWKLGRIRMPLAKFEPSGANKSTDYAVPVSIIDNINNKLGWKISAIDNVFRSDLADEFRESLSQLA